MLMTSLTPLGNTSELHQWQNRPFATEWPEQRIKNATNAEVPRTYRKKPKRTRTAYTTEQLRTLEKTYTRKKYITADDRINLAAMLNVSEKSIKVWFQNKRMKEKRELSESTSDTSTEASSVMSPPITSTTPAFDYPISPAVSPPKSPLKYTADNSGSSYQLPTFHIQVHPDQNRVNPRSEQYQDTYHQNGVIPSAQTRAFVNEGGVYPTQYYPYSFGNNFSDGNHFYNNNIGTNSDYWSPSCFDLSYI